MRKLFAALGLLTAVGCAAAFAQVSGSVAPAKVTFRRIFRGSSPEFIELCIWDDGKKATYEIRQLDDDAGSTPFEVGDALRSKIFALTAQLHDFEGLDLDVHRKIANLGEKTFRWEQGNVFHEAKFNYTLNPAAAQLLQIFEGLARQQEHFELITRRMRYDRLGIYDALLQFETDLNRGLLPEPQRLAPLLDQIASDPKYVEVARERARMFSERVKRGS
jgi:hypothetical protein